MVRKVKNKSKERKKNREEELERERLREEEPEEERRNREEEVEEKIRFLIWFGRSGMQSCKLAIPVSRRLTVSENDTQLEFNSFV